MLADDVDPSSNMMKDKDMSLSLSQSLLDEISAIALPNVLGQRSPISRNKWPLYCRTCRLVQKLDSFSSVSNLSKLRMPTVRRK